MRVEPIKKSAKSDNNHQKWQEQQKKFKEILEHEIKKRKIG